MSIASVRYQTGDPKANRMPRMNPRDTGFLDPSSNNHDSFMSSSLFMTERQPFARKLHIA